MFMKSIDWEIRGTVVLVNAIMSRDRPGVAMERVLLGPIRERIVERSLGKAVIS